MSGIAASPLKHQRRHGKEIHYAKLRSIYSPAFHRPDKRLMRAIMLVFAAHQLRLGVRSSRGAAGQCKEALLAKASSVASPAIISNVARYLSNSSHLEASGGRCRVSDRRYSLLATTKCRRFRHLLFFIGFRRCHPHMSRRVL